MDKRGYSKILDLPYRFDSKSGKVAFASGVEYTLKETLQISTFTDIDVKAIHMVKELFDIPLSQAVKKKAPLPYTPRTRMAGLKGEQIDLFVEPSPMEKLRERISLIKD